MKIKKHFKKYFTTCTNIPQIQNTKKQKKKKRKMIKEKVNLLCLLTI